jgi:hypothetical protein
MLTWKDVAAAEARRRSRRRRSAENEQLSSFLPQVLYPQPRHARALAWLGAQLIRLGSRLRARYANRSMPLEQLPGPTRS